MSMLSPIALQAGATIPSSPVDRIPILAGWGLLIDTSLKIVRNMLAAKLAALKCEEIDAPPVQIEAALAECDAIEASTASLVKPYRAKYQSILGHLVADLEAVVAHAEHETKIASLQAHYARLEDLMTISDDAAGLSNRCADPE